MSEFLQFLIPDRDYGYLFPHSRAVAAFGVMNEYHITKHRAHLTEGVHYIKSAGNGAPTMWCAVFYTFSGLFLLADLVGSAQAVHLKQALLDHAQRQTQAPGALVPSQGARGLCPAYTGSHQERQPDLTIPFPYAQPVQPQQWGQPAIPQPGQGQLVPNAHGYLPVPQGTQLSGSALWTAYRSSAPGRCCLSTLCRSQCLSAFGHGSKSAGAILTACGSAVTNTMLRAHRSNRRHTSHAPTSKPLVIPTSQPQQRSTPDVLLLQPSASYGPRGGS